MDLIVFDADGTLFDSVYYYVETYHHLYSKYGLFIPHSKINHHIGMGSDKTIRLLAPEEWCVKHEKDVLSQAREHFIEHYLDKVGVFPKTKEFIQKLQKDGKKVALATMSSSSVVETYLERLGNDVAFDFVTTSCDVERSKPDPDIFLNVLEHFPDIPKEKMCVVGDSTWDILAANAAGLSSIGVLTGGYSQDMLEGAGAICVKDDIKELYQEYCAIGDSLFMI